MVESVMDRRRFLAGSLTLGCSAAVTPLWTPASFAAAPWDTRLIVIILRGAMDGLDVVRPWEDADFRRLRPHIDRRGIDDGSLLLEKGFALNPGLAGLMPLWAAGELGFVHAVSTPYRDKRSHFTGQDILEAGVVDAAGAVRSDGWLNRMLQHVPGVTAETTYAIGRDDMLIARGPAPVSSWSPGAALGVIDVAARRRLEKVMEADILLRGNLKEAIELSGLADADTPSARQDPRRDLRQAALAAQREGVQELARFAAEKLRGESRIATFSLTGWDTHADQERAIALPLKRLETAILALKEELGPVWSKTGLIAMTEFGRTAATNGTGGTDHGTGGAMLFAGGALRGGRVYGDWPGLAESDLYAGRDLLPTRDVRAHAGWIMRGLFGLSRSELEQVVFPGLEIGANPKLVL